MPRASLVITGEGTLDATSLGGKAPVALSGRSQSLGLSVVAAVGRSALTGEQCHRLGFEQVFQLVKLAESPEQSMRDAARLLEQTGRKIAEWFESWTAVTGAWITRTPRHD